LRAWAEYYEGLRRAARAERRRRARLRCHALEAAHSAALVLARDFGAGEVYAFGSLVAGGAFGPESDIDLAVTGLPPARYFAALGALERLRPDYRFDLVLLEEAPKALRRRIVERGVKLWPRPES
jgi:predicted nucleotidyltransferase